MCEMPQAFTTKQRKAAKAHICCECGNFIHPGEKYQYSSGIWDGEPQAFKQCCNCHELMEAASQSAEFCDEARAFEGCTNGLITINATGLPGKNGLTAWRVFCDCPSESDCYVLTERID